jgi:hypothetical protein
LPRCAIEIAVSPSSDGAGEAKDPMKAPCRPAEPRRHALQEVRRRIVEAAMPVERLAGELAVGAAWRSTALARLADATRDGDARFAVGRCRELRRGDGGHLDLNVDALE